MFFVETHVFGVSRIEIIDFLAFFSYDEFRERFWSVTAYGKDDFLIDNPIDRYCINDRSVLNRNADGSVDVTLSHAMPENTENWLPIGETEFHLFLRIYKPDWNTLRSWQPPTVCVKSTQI